MKIDCSKTENYLKERARMTKGCIPSSCFNCPLGQSNNPLGLKCKDLEGEFPTVARDIVQKWSDERPQKTYREDFFEKFPKADCKRAPDGKCYPMCTPCELYPELREQCQHSTECFNCWNRAMEE